MAENKETTSSYKEGAQYKVNRNYTGKIDGKVRSFTQGRYYKLSKKEYEVLSKAGEVELKG